MSRGKSGLYVVLNRDAMQIEKCERSPVSRYHDSREHLRDAVPYADEHDMYVSTDQVLSQAARDMQYDCPYESDGDEEII
jgi:hypothetical protein